MDFLLFLLLGIPSFIFLCIFFYERETRSPKYRQKLEIFVNNFHSYNNETIKKELQKNSLFGTRELSKIYLMLNSIEKRERFENFLGKDVFLNMRYNNNDVHLKSLEDTTEQIRQENERIKNIINKL